MSRYSKAIVAFLAQVTALSVAFANLLADGIITTPEWSTILPLIVATIVTPIGVYLVPNSGNGTYGN